MNKLKQTKGITLVALVLTIIILLILAGISISALTNQGLFAEAEEAKKRTENAQKDEEQKLKNYVAEINEAIGNNDKPATTIAEAQTDDMLTKKVNSPMVDAYGNKITVPAGFKITGGATTVDKGIVIIDSNENEFVWIPVGTIYTNAEKTASKTIELGRYVFKEDGTIDTTLSQTEPEGQLKTSSSSSYYYTEGKASDTTTNTHAKDIETFRTKASATQSGGFYIGRYEARTGTARSAKTDELTTLTTKASDYVYNYVTQIQAADLARNMYPNAKTFTSDLMNSYAWDTATLFLQTCGDNETYSRKTSVNSKLATTGTNNQETKDVQCNVYDMASNIVEWTTETFSFSSGPCVLRGGDYGSSEFYMSRRSNYSTSFSSDDVSFRPLLYVNV